MSCVNPLSVKVVLDDNTGALRSIFRGFARYDNPKDYGSYEDLTTKGYFITAIPCRSCIGCRIDYGRHWADRLTLELQDHDRKAIFLTLTYDKFHVPFCDDGFTMTLRLRDFQLFMKRLRKKFHGRRIRYYACGEYGPKNMRPHYHAIIFGISMDDFKQLRPVHRNELGQISYTDPELAKVWDNGFISFSHVTYNTCAYVSRYVLKKHFNVEKADLYPADPEFAVMSRKPGIGLLNAEKRLLSGDSFFTFTDQNCTKSIPLPKEIIRYGVDHDICLDRCLELKYTKGKTANEMLLSKIEMSGGNYDCFLRNHCRELWNRVKKLPERK